MSWRSLVGGLPYLRVPFPALPVPFLVAAGFIVVVGVSAQPADGRPTRDEPFLLAPVGAPMGEILDRPWVAGDGVMPSSSRVVYGPDPSNGAIQSAGGVQSRSPLAYADTVSFGYVDGDGFAVLGETWTFDHSGPDPLEGWEGVDRTEQDGAFGRQISATSWNADPYNDVPAPILSGDGSAWIGVFGTEARGLCYDSGLGYGNSWDQRLASPTYPYDGTSDVTLQWTHFNDTEENFDYSRVILERFPSGERDPLREYTAQVGLAPDHPASPPVGVVDDFTLTSADFQG
ncbi:MAG: hypothetical protein KDA27_28625, partial [Candidatus Eisenbacteria bacterium]|nr:hypothetical protein [Candidatus Eisenbacteria bacterium]